MYKACVAFRGWLLQAKKAPLIGKGLCKNTMQGTLDSWKHKEEKVMPYPAMTQVHQIL